MQEHAAQPGTALLVVADDSRSRVLYWLLFAIVFVVLIWPLWEFRYPSMVDYPDHVSRVNILRNWSHEPVFQQRYAIVAKPFPNLAFDLLGVYVFGQLGIYSAGRAALTLLMLLFCGGCHLLGLAAHGRPTWLAPLASLSAYNSMFLYGFVNYSFGVALFLISLAAWIWWRRSRSVLRFVLVTVLATATYMAHLMGIAALAVAAAAIASYDVLREKRWRAAFLVDGLPFVPSAVLYAGLGRYRGDTSTVVWGPLLLKAKHLVPWLMGYTTTVSIVCGIAVLVSAGIVLWRARIRAGAPLLAVGGLLWLLAAVFPAEQLFSGSDADARLVVPALVVTLLALDFDMPRRWARVAFALVLAALCARVVEIRFFWRDGDSLTRSQVTLLQSVPKASRVFPIIWMPDATIEGKRERHLLHSVKYATIDNLAFFPHIMDVVGQQPLTLKYHPYYRTVAAGARPEDVPWERVFQDYDFVYTYRVSDAFRRFLESSCDLSGSAGRGSLYRVRKPF